MNNKYLRSRKLKNTLSYVETDVLAQIILHSPHIIFWKDENLIFRGCNLEFARLMGFDDPADLIGKTDYQLPLESQFIEFARQEEMQVINTGGAILNKKRLLKLDVRDVKEKLFSISKVPLYDDNNQIIGCLANCVDITEQEKTSERLLKEIEFNTEFLEQFLLKKTGSRLQFDEAKEYVEALSDYYDCIIGNMPGNVYWLNKDGTLLGGNDNLAKMFGLNSRADLVGLDYDDMARLASWTEDQGKVFRQNEIEVMESKQPIFNKEEPPVIVNGKKTYYLANKVPLFDKRGDVIGVLGISLDITSKREIEQALLTEKNNAERANQSKTQFLMDISHQVRTPLTGILGMASLVHDKISDPELSVNLDLLKNSAKELENLFNDMLAYIKISSGKAHEEKSTFNLAYLVETVSALIRPAAELKNLKFQVNIDANLPKYFSGNKILLKSILLNLISNALKFTEEGGISLVIQSLDNSKPDSEESLLQITVADTGIGIPKEKFDSIFESFVMLTPAHAGKYSGHGLGLYLVKQYLESLNGQIDVESQVGKGSRFIVSLPLQVVEQSEVSKEQLTQQVKIQSSELQSQNDVKILLVEDHAIAAKVEIALFEKCGYEVDRVESGEEALDKLEKNDVHYDLIYMDIGLPGMDGFQAAAKIRKLNGNPNSTVPVIALTAHLLDNSSGMDIDELMQEVVIKPISLQKAQEITAKYLQ